MHAIRFWSVRYIQLNPNTYLVSISSFLFSQQQNGSCREGFFLHHFQLILFSTFIPFCLLLSHWRIKIFREYCKYLSIFELYIHLIHWKVNLNCICFAIELWMFRVRSLVSTLYEIAPLNICNSSFTIWTSTVMLHSPKCACLAVHLMQLNLI
jgi:hypothetical protein